MDTNESSSWITEHRWPDFWNRSEVGIGIAPTPQYNKHIHNNNRNNTITIQAHTQSQFWLSMYLSLYIASSHCSGPMVQLYIIHHIHIHIESVELPALFCLNLAYMTIIKQIKNSRTVEQGGHSLQFRRECYRIETIESESESGCIIISQYVRQCCSASKKGGDKSKWRWGLRMLQQDFNSQVLGFVKQVGQIPA